MTPLLRTSRLRLSQGQLFWREMGHGTHLVFLHGSWADGDQWLPLMEKLSDRYHCLAPDLLGFGESERPKLKYSVNLQVDCLAEYLEKLKLKQCYLVGHSLGGWIAASYALKHLDQVRGLILIGPEGVETRLKGRWSLDRWLFGQIPLFPWLLRLVQPLAKLFRIHQKIQALFARRRQWRRSPVAAKLLFRRRATEITAELLDGRLQWLKVPTLLVQGEADEMTVRALSVTYAGQLPDVSYRQLPEFNSLNMVLTETNQLATVIQEFIEQSRSPSVLKQPEI